NFRPSFIFEGCQMAAARLARRADVAETRSCSSLARRASRRRKVFASRAWVVDGAASIGSFFARKGVWIRLKAMSAFWRQRLYFSVMGVPRVEARQARGKRKARRLAWPS